MTSEVTLGKEDIVIRDFSEEDFTDVMEIWKVTDLGRPERGDGLDTILISLKLGGKFLVMENSVTKKVIGTSWMTFDGRRIHLHHFGILPEFQGRGLSNLLLTESLKFAKYKNIQIKLEVHQNNFKAINLYKKFGFEYLGDYDIYIIRDFSGI